MPGLAGDDRVERPPGGVPRLEGRHFSLDAGSPGELGHPRVGFYAEHRATGRLELPGGDARATADVEDVEAGAGGDDPLHEGAGVAGPNPVAPLGVHTE